MEEMTNYESLQELFVDKETQELIKKWKMSNEKQKKEVFKSTLSDTEYQKLAPIFKTLKEETENYAPYYKAFKALCKFCHIVPNGTIITKYELKKGKKEDNSTILVEYTYNAKPITLPAGTKLYHQSVVAGIKELIPKWKLRGKNENGYLCEAPRIYLTMSKSLPTISTDNKFMSKMHTYEVLRQPTKVYIDPLLPDVFQKAVYVETVTPIPVKEIEKESLVKKASEVVKKTVLKENVSDKVQEYQDKRHEISDLEFAYDKKFNAFCLTVSGYSIEKLEHTLANKQAALEDAKKEKANADNRDDKLKAQLKISFLQDCCNKCQSMIRKKKSYHKGEY